ncbi:MAG TPA: rhodanese-like domain-containing protein [Gammaproteobacteria bacterium]|nr:rhodanese-like domain-containing protein [Gammaproteobacteria bacterium]
MEEWVVFITNHWVLASLLGVVLTAFIINEIIGGHFGSKQAVSTERAVQMMNHEEAVVFDVRTEAEFSTGHIVGAEQLTAISLDKKMSHLQKYLKKPIIIATTTGQDTAKMMAVLQEKGFLQIFILSGGMQAWKSAGMPVIKL